MSEEKIINIKQQEPKKRRIDIERYLPMIAVVILAISVLVVFVGTFFNARELKDAYSTNLEKEKSETYNDIYDHYYDLAFHDNHVTNDMSISIEEIREVSNLEVLKVSDIELITDDSTAAEHNITVWLEVPGEADFIVNMQAAEFVIDELRHSVLVRIPEPELANLKIDVKNIRKLFFKNDRLNDSIEVGEKVARQMLEKGELKIKKELLSNQIYMINAKRAAKNAIVYLVKELNPYFDVMVEVEFY